MLNTLLIIIIHGIIYDIIKLITLKVIKTILTK